MQRSLKDYMLMAKKTYKYRMKFAFDMTETHFERLELILSEFGLIKVSAITRTPVQLNPLDFPSIKAAEVYIFDIETDLPFSEYALRFKIQTLVGIPEKCIAIRSENSPYNKYEQDIIDFQTKKYVPKLNDPEYKSDGEPSDEPTLNSQEYVDDMVKTITPELTTDHPFVTDSSEFRKSLAALFGSKVTK